MVCRPFVTPELISLAADWPELAGDILKAIESLERTVVPTGGPGHILLKVAPDLQSLQAQWWDSQTGCPGEGSRVQLRFGEMPLTTDESRTEAQFAEPVAPPNATIDRAISKAAADMLSYATDPDTFELLTVQRYQLWLQWPGGQPARVYEFAYGLWDE